MLALWTAKATGKQQARWIDTTLWNTPKLIELGKSTMRNNTDVVFMPLEKYPEEMTLRQAIYWLEFYRLMVRRINEYEYCQQLGGPIVKEGLKIALSDAMRWGPQVKAFLATPDPLHDGLHRGAVLHPDLDTHIQLVEAMKC